MLLLHRTHPAGIACAFFGKAWATTAARGPQLMKRLAVVMAAGVLTLGLGACGDADAGSDNTGEPVPEQDGSTGGSIVSTPENVRD